ncbi:MAG: cupin domain-containing protein [Candidatus Aminicenantes bacterium]|nr:cupin domain-containing protein [Candidatus Aminicenantes bacterium]
MKLDGFPEFIQNLPEANLPVDTVRGWLLNGENGQVLFIQADETTKIPEHKHGDQWGIVVAGEIELTIGDKTAIYHQGDSYNIPAGTPHKAVLHKGFCALDIFADKDRYRTRS